MRSAASIGKLDELQTTVDEIDGKRGKSFPWYKNALGVLIACQRNDVALAEERLGELTRLQNKTIPISADYLAAWSAASAFPDSLAVLDYVVLANNRRVKNADTRKDMGFKTQFRALKAQLQTNHVPDSARAISTVDLPPGMITAEEYNALSQSQGRPNTIWGSTRSGQTHHLAGHEKGHLYLATPLLGDYTIEADLAPWYSTTIHHLGQNVQSSPDKIGLSIIGGNMRESTIDPPLAKPKDWLRYRQEIRGRLSTIYLNGRMVYERVLSQPVDPWLAVRGWWKGTAVFRGLSIVGDVQIPDVVPMSAGKDLTGWTDYYGKNYNSAMPDWTKIATDGSKVISGPRGRIEAGSAFERLLQYHRPLTEDGWIDLEFFYQAGQASVAPALGRLALLMNPDGVDQHWISDGRFESTTMRTDHRQRIADYQTHNGKLPLLEGQWNRLRTEIRNQSVVLHLNDQPIFKCPLPSDLDRKFGVFYFADQHAVKVRNVTMHGDWPKQLPKETHYSDSVIASLDQHRDSLPAKIDLALNQGGVVGQFFAPSKNVRYGSATIGTSGREVQLFSNGKWEQFSLSPAVSIQGDFDVEVSFEDLVVPLKAKDAGPRITIALDDDSQHELSVAIGNHAGSPGMIRGGISLASPDGSKIYRNYRTGDESSSGRMRIIRKGKTSYYLFAQGDSPIFRLLSQYEVSDGDVPLNKLQMLFVNSGSGQSSVTWSRIKLHAQTILRSSTGGSNVKGIGVLDLETGKFKMIARGTVQLHNVGSPKWSPDQKSIAFDRNSASIRDSRLLVVDIESGVERDIGFGSMPNYSPDGKQLAFSGYAQGVGIVDADGGNRRILDRSAWGIQWSPKQDFLAYASGTNINIWNLKTDSATGFMSGAATTRYNNMNWNMKWSHDGRKIVFMGSRQDGSGKEIAVVSLDQRDKIQVLRSADGLVVDFSWSGDDQYVLVAEHPQGQEQSRLWKLPVNGDKAAIPMPIPVPKEAGKVLGAVWSPDQKQLALTLLPPAQLVPVENVSNVAAIE